MTKPGSNPAYTRKRIQRIYGSTFVDGNKVTLLWKNQELFRTIFNAVADAQELICLEFYIFRNDETGTELAEILKRKAAEGVQVYVLHDHFGSLGTSSRFWRSLREAGVHIRASRPFKWKAPFHYIHRDHKKLIIIDGVRAFTGGLNIANEYRGYHRTRKREGWRDTGIFLEGPVATALFENFSKTWELWKGEAIPFNKTVEPRNGGLPVLPIFASSAKGRRKMRKLLYYSIMNARESIHLTTAYFTPSRRMIHVLEDAVKRGVSVRLLLPGKSDIQAAHHTGRAFYGRLLRAGVEIHLYHGEILHAKTSVFDGQWSIIGSANLDFQSLRRNDEGNVGIIDRAFGDEMIGMFNGDLLRSETLEASTWRRRPLCDKISEHLYSLFRRRL